MNSSERKRFGPFLIRPGTGLVLTLSAGIAIPQEKSIQEIAGRIGINVPQGSIERTEKGSTAYHVSLKDLTKLALQNNLDIARGTSVQHFH